MSKTISIPGIEEYMRPYIPYFYRSEGHALSMNYIVGQLLDGERKSVEPMAERVHASERGMQRLLADVVWDHDGVIGEYRRRMLQLTSDPQGVLAIDDTGFPKKGRHSVCVARQYCGARGKVDNCQVGVSLAYVGQDVAWPFGMKLFVPVSWDDPAAQECREKRRKTHMPETARHREKWKVALDLLDEARAMGAPHRAVVGDSWYGDIPDFRKSLEERGEHYVVGVYSDAKVFLEPPVFELPPPAKRKRGRPSRKPRLVETNPPPVKVSVLGGALREEDWECLEIRKNCRGKPLLVEAVARRVWPAHGYRQGARHEETWLIIERRRNEQGDPELRYHFSNLPQETPTLEMVRLFHERFWIENGYQQLKEELGLDHHEGRSWPGWHRHVILTFLAYGYLAGIRLQEKKLCRQRFWESRLQGKMTG
jgi:SRSO17 transposase